MACPELWRVFFKKVGKLEEMGGLPHQLLIYFNNDIGANVEGMQPVMRDYGKNPQNVCKRKIVLRHFGFDISKSLRQTQLL